MTFPNGVWNNEMWKTAARAGLRRISSLIQGGNLSAANNLAKTPGVLKPAIAGTATAAGSAIRDLGKGSEGLATLVAHPQHGVAVRKLYDPTGISGPSLIDRKVRAGQAIGQGNKYVAGFKGQATAPHGAPMHFSEFVNSKGPIPAPVPGSLAEREAIKKTQVRTSQANIRAGFSGGARDVRKTNMQWDGQQGNFKTIDYIPSNRGEFNLVIGDSLYDPNTGNKRPLAGLYPQKAIQNLRKEPEQLVSAIPGRGAEGLWNPDMALDPAGHTSAARLKQQQFGGEAAVNAGVVRDARRAQMKYLAKKEKMLATAPMKPPAPVTVAPQQDATKRLQFKRPAFAPAG